MSQIVWSHASEVGTLGGGPEVPRAEVALASRPARAVRPDELITGLGRRTGGGGRAASESGSGTRRTAAGLGVLDRYDARCLRRGSLHLDPTGIEIEVADLQAEGLADAQASKGEEADEQTRARRAACRMAATLDGGGEFVISVASRCDLCAGERKRFVRTGDLAMRMPSTGLARIAPARIAVPQICESTLRCLEIEAAESPRSDCSADPDGNLVMVESPDREVPERRQDMDGQGWRGSAIGSLPGARRAWRTIARRTRRPFVSTRRWSIQSPRARSASTVARNLAASTLRLNAFSCWRPLTR